MYLPLTLFGIALFSSKEAHRLVIVDVLWAVYDGNHFALGTNGLTGTSVLATATGVCTQNHSVMRRNRESSYNSPEARKRFITNGLRRLATEILGHTAV